MWFARSQRLVWVFLLAILLFGPTTGFAQDGIAQYRAAVTKIFLWKYSAIPIFRQNPIFPGTVLRLSNEAIQYSPDRCYSTKQGGRYRETQEYIDGMTVSRNADLRVKGDLLSSKLVAIEAGTGVKFDRSVSIAVTPLSNDTFSPDEAALREVRDTSECQLVLRLLDGTEGGSVVVYQVLHGMIRYQVGLGVGGTVDLSASSPLLATIEKVFDLKSVDIGLGVKSLSFSIAATAAPQTLAVVPSGFNLDELARITYYLQGKRGADLETAVQEALVAGDLDAFRRLQIRIQGILGDEINQKEQWAERFVGGKDKVPAAALRSDFSGKVDFKKLGTYAAAMELLRQQ